MVFKECEVYSTKNVNIAFALAEPKSKMAKTQSKIWELPPNSKLTIIL